MRSRACWSISLLSIVDLAYSQAAEPQLRPALVGNGPDALVNLIDTKKMLVKGQGDAALFFSCYVSASGRLVDAVTYARTPESNALDRAVISGIERCRFIPAVYNGKRVIFFVKDGTPHLRVFAN
jgi:hypothetical protein